MRTTITLLLAALTMCTACKKGKIDTDAKNAIQGKWNLVRITGGLAGLDMSAAQWGHTQSYEFKSNYKCNYTYDGNTTATTYTLYKAPSYTENAAGDFVTIASNKMTYEYSFAHDTLVMSMDVRVDGTVEWYVSAP